MEKKSSFSSRLLILLWQERSWLQGGKALEVNGMGTEGEGQGEELKGEPSAASSLSQASTFMFWREKGAGGSRGLSQKPAGQQAACAGE